MSERPTDRYAEESLVNVSFTSMPALKSSKVVAEEHCRTTAERPKELVAILGFDISEINAVKTAYLVPAVAPLTRHVASQGHS